MVTRVAATASAVPVGPHQQIHGTLSLWLDQCGRLSQFALRLVTPTAATTTGAITVAATARVSCLIMLFFILFGRQSTTPWFGLYLVPVALTRVVVLGVLGVAPPFQSLVLSRKVNVVATEV